MDGNLGNQPPDLRGFWKKIHKYTTWTTATAYTSGNFVLHSEILYKCIKNHTSSNSLKPPDSSHLWEEGDLCGKTLVSCNIRYNANPLDITGPDSLMSTTTRGVSSLPFGGFPGSNKHR